MAAKRNPEFDPKSFLANIGEGRTVLSFQKKQSIFNQGDACDAVFYIQEGKVKLTVVSARGKEAIVGIWSEMISLGKGV